VLHPHAKFVVLSLKLRKFVSTAADVELTLPLIQKDCGY